MYKHLPSSILLHSENAVYKPRDMMTSSVASHMMNRCSSTCAITVVSLLALVFLLSMSSASVRIERFPAFPRTKTNDIIGESADAQSNGKVNAQELMERVTTRQCSSVLNYIHSGVGFASNNGATTDATTTTTTTKTFIPSIHNIWQETVHPKLLRHALRWANFKLGNNKTVVNFGKMIHDYTKVHNEYIVPRLRSSLIRPMEGKQIQRILQIIEDRLMDPIKNPRLEIMVFGGSVVQGWHSEFHNWFQPGFENEVKPDCATFSWPARLEAILNEVIFYGQDVVRVTNMAVGGTTSDVGAVALEYELFPPEYPGPDIIIHSYGNNDGRQPGPDIDRLNLMQEFIRAARTMNCDADKQPSIILYDDFLGFYFNDIHYAMGYSQYVSKAAAWYDLMAVSFANAFRHTVYSGDGFGNDTAVEHDPGGDLPMLGWRLELHPGMLYHSTSPWTLVYNLLDNMINACQDYETMSHYRPAFDELPLNQIPELTREFMLSDLPEKWNENIAHHQDVCQSASDRIGSVCAPTSWIAGAFAGARSQPIIDEQMRELFLSGNDGWHVESISNSKPRPGWVAFRAKATFTVTVKDHEGITFVTVISMQSYGSKWEGSLVRVTLFDYGPEGAGPISVVGLYEISGSHNTTTSVLHPHKLQLDGNGVPKGNWLNARFDLVGGTTFRIQGMLFCTR